MAGLGNCLEALGRSDEALPKLQAALGMSQRLFPGDHPKVSSRLNDVASCLGRAVSFETRLSVQVEAGADMTVQGDPDQLEQVLINLLRNAADASLVTSGRVRIGWRRDGSMLEIWIRDDGPGLSGTANLFVPFFTTKPGGSGIGLVLSRQIAEGHGGALMLENRTDGQGCIARLRLPAPVDSHAA